MSAPSGTIQPSPHPHPESACPIVRARTYMDWLREQRITEVRTYLMHFQNVFKPIYPSQGHIIPYGQFHTHMKRFIHKWCTIWYRFFVSCAQQVSMHLVPELESELMDWPLGGDVYLRSLIVAEVEAVFLTRMCDQLMSFVTDEIIVHWLAYKAAEVDDTLLIETPLYIAEFEGMLKIKAEYSINFLVSTVTSTGSVYVHLNPPLNRSFEHVKKVQ